MSRVDPGGADAVDRRGRSASCRGGRWLLLVQGPARCAGAHVFRASRLSRGNLLFPTQVAVTPTSIVHFTPELFGGREQSIHLAHVASVLIDRNLFFADVMIESSGGASPVRCHGHRKADAVEMKRLIEQFQSEYYRARGGAPAGAAAARTAVP